MLTSVLSLSMLGLVPATGLETRWHGEPGCVVTEQLGSWVAALMDRPRSPAATLELAASSSGDQWRISLHVHSATHSFERTLRGRDCTTLSQAVALIVAVQLDPLAVNGMVPPQTPARGEAVAAKAPVALVVSSPPTANEPVATPSPAPQHPPVTTASTEPPPPSPRVRALMGTALAAERGVFPRGAAALELSAGIAWSRARVELGGLVFVGPDAVAPGTSMVGARFRLFAGQIRGCGQAGRGRFELPLCAGLELGDLRATGTGLTRPATVDALWLAAVGGARPQWSLRPRLAVGALFDLVVPLRRHRFTTAETGTLHVVDPVAARLGVRLELRLP